jgi:hypothetical protein
VNAIRGTVILTKNTDEDSFRSPLGWWETEKGVGVVCDVWGARLGWADRVQVDVADMPVEGWRRFEFAAHDEDEEDSELALTFGEHEIKRTATDLGIALRELGWDTHRPLWVLVTNLEPA